jgi:opacity protein-like surface antigen
MRSFLSLCLALGVFLLLSTPQLEAQTTYKSAIGARLGYPLSASYKTFINETNAIEAYVNFRRWGNLFTGGFSYTRIGLGAAYLIHQQLGENTPGLQWYYGGGAGVYFYSYSNDAAFNNPDNLGFGLQGFIGLDYTFEDTPINLTLDWAPTFYIGGYDASFAGAVGSLGVRYVLSDW